MFKKIKHITLNENSVYLTFCQFYDDFNIQFFTAQDLFNEANKIFKYVGYHNSCRTTSILTPTLKNHDLKSVVCNLDGYSADLYWDNNEENED